MNNPFEPNHRGLVVVRLTKNYSANVAGETAGFLPEIAKELVKKGAAVLPGQSAPQAATEAQEGPEITTRKFKPAEQPSAIDGLRVEFKELTGNDADARWGEARLKAEIDKALEAATKPADA